MITYRELRETSLDFRRLSSYLLNSTYENVDVQLERFVIFIDSNSFIKEKILAKISGVEFNFLECFVYENEHSWSHIQVPVDEACHVKAMYDYLAYIRESEKGIYSHARAFSKKSKFNEMIQEFLKDAFKPLIDFINDAISKEMILLEEEKKISSASLTQNIGTVYGTVNQQNTGMITSYNSTTSAGTEILELISRMTSALEYMNDVSQESIEDVRDDLDSVTEQILSSVPKKNRLQKALLGIKKFVSECGMKLAVNWATGKITEVDWITAVEKIGQYISTL